MCGFGHFSSHFFVGGYSFSRVGKTKFSSFSLSTQPNFAAEADDGGGDAEVAAFFPAVNALGRTSGSRGTMTSKKPLMKHLKLVERFPRFLTRFRNVHSCIWKN